jgi:hypothetical protein
MPDVRARLSNLPPVRGHAPWPGHEYVKGWGVFGLPFDSGHVLALRVFPENDFGPYRSLWHRDPEGRWSIYLDGPRLDTGCPRYFGPACAETDLRRIEVEWIGPASVQVRMDSPSLDWRLTATETPMLAVMNVVHAAMPLSTWRSPMLIRARETMVRAMGLGRLQMSGVTPSGHTGTLMPQRMYFVDESSATIDGTELGHPVHLKDSPTIGGVALPARGILAIGQGMWQILDPDEYARTRAEMNSMD